jgi:hypothetical protein
MTAGSKDVPDEAIEQIEHGLDAYFAGDTARRLLEAIDREALIEEATVEEPVDYEQVGEVLGRLIARAVIKDLSGRGLLGQTIETTIGQELGGSVGGAAVTAFIEAGAPEAIAEFGDELTATTRDLGLQDALFDARPDTTEWDGDDITTIDIEDGSDDENTTDRP